MRNSINYVICADVMGVQANILVDAAAHARIVDFGIASVARGSESISNSTDQFWFTPRFTAPEILKGAKCHSKESDVFAFGMVIIEVG